jgi:hypothetical protein
MDQFRVLPLWELMMSLVALRAPGEHSLHLPWIRSTRSLVADLDLSEVFAIAPVRGTIADFLTPAPTEPLPDLAAELTVVRNTDPARVLLDLDDVGVVPDKVMRRIRRDPEAVVARIADTLQSYWMSRSPTTGRPSCACWRPTCCGGRSAWRPAACTPFPGPAPGGRPDGDRLTAADRHDYAGELSSSDLTLVFHAMGWPRVRKMIEPYQPMIAYPARGVATPLRAACRRTRHPHPGHGFGAVPPLRQRRRARRMTTGCQQEETVR